MDSVINGSKDKLSSKLSDLGQSGSESTQLTNPEVQIQGNFPNSEV